MVYRLIPDLYGREGHKRFATLVSLFLGSDADSSDKFEIVGKAVVVVESDRFRRARVSTRFTKSTVPQRCLDSRNVGPCNQRSIRDSQYPGRLRWWAIDTIRIASTSTE